MTETGVILTKGSNQNRNIIVITKEFTFRLLSFENLYYLLENNQKLLRETLSYIAFEDENKIISEEDFYFDKWDLSQNELDLNDFLEKTRTHKGKYRIFEVRNDNELLLITEDTDREKNDYFYELNTHTDKTTIYTFKCDDKEKLLLLKRLLEADTNTAVIKCVLVSYDYRKSKEPMYDRFELKTNKKVREINAPKKDVKEALRALLAVLNSSFEHRKRKTNQFAYRPNLSIKDNVNIHKNNKYVLKTDITAFFDNCNSSLVFNHIYPIMFDERYKNITSNRIRHDSLFNVIHDYLYPMIIDIKTDGLFMGSPVSGVLSNMIIRPAVLYLQNILENDGFSVSVYADDITVSHPLSFNYKKVIKTINYVFEYFYLPFELKDEKTRYLVNNGRRVTGIRINHKNEMTIDRKQYKLMRTLLDNLSKGNKITMDLPTLEGRLNFYIFVDESGKFAKLATKYLQTLIDNNINVNVCKGQLMMDI